RLGGIKHSIEDWDHQEMFDRAVDEAGAAEFARIQPLGSPGPLNSHEFRYARVSERAPARPPNRARRCSGSRFVTRAAPSTAHPQAATAASARRPPLRPSPPPHTG